MKNTKHTKVREWYVEAYPHDELAHSIAENITFEDVSAALDHRKDVYKLFGVADSCIRENIFSELAVIMEVNYDCIYEQWMLCDEEEEEIVIVPNIKYYTCPECQEETLKYAMIDLDGTNIEEGFLCSECNTNFIGLDNELVINTNPEIVEQSITDMNKTELKQGDVVTYADFTITAKLDHNNEPILMAETKEGQMITRLGASRHIVDLYSNIEDNE